MRSVAHAALLVLRSSVAAIHASSTSGDINLAAASLLPVYFLFARDSDAADRLRRYFLHIVLLCDFHVWQAIERKLAGVDVLIAMCALHSKTGCMRSLLAPLALRVRLGHPSRRGSAS